MANAQPRGFSRKRREDPEPPNDLLGPEGCRVSEMPAGPGDQPDQSQGRAGGGVGARPLSGPCLRGRKAAAVFREC